MTAAPVESAILIKVPEVEYIVGPHRRTLDPSAGWGVPAHVTLLYPFLHPSTIDADVLRRLTEVVARHPEFEVQFLQTEWFGKEVLWLRPEPDLSFRHLTHALAATFPATPPYGGEILDPTPHLTVAEGASFHDMRHAESAVVKQLPVHVSFSSVSVMVGAPKTNSWITIADMPLSKE
jgi:2'-5' RNA ligase